MVGSYQHIGNGALSTGGFILEDTGRITSVDTAGDPYRRSGDIADALEEESHVNEHDSRPLTFTESQPYPYAPARGASPSMLRRLSTRLGFTKSRSSRTTRQGKYATIDDHISNTTAVDPASLERIGIELIEVHGRTDTIIDNTSHDTAYHGSSQPSAKPSFASFRKRQTLGYGMIVGAQLRQSPSQRAPEPAGHAPQSNIKRMQTMRQVGQNLAEERGQMVAFDAPPIDLSSLDGMGLPDSRRGTFDEMNLSRASTAPDTQSYFFPSDPNIPDWKPFSMRLPYMTMLGALAIGLAGFQEYLCQMSLKEQAKTPKSALLAFDSVDQVSVGLFFVWKYLPTIITISYSVLFSIMDFDIRRLEPFYQLSKAHGARASESLNLDHLTMFQYFIPITAAHMGQWTVVVSSLANIIAATVAPALQNPSVNFEPNPLCDRTTCPGDLGARFWVLIDPIWSRLLTAAYLIVGSCTIFLAVQLRRHSGLLSNPQGIAGIASMATKSHILHDFKGLDLATRKDIHKRLAHRTYVLYKSSIWQGEFSWNSSTDAFHDSEKRLTSPHPITLRLKAGIPFIVVLIICLGLIPVISLTPARVVPNKLPWLPILVATLIKLVWTTFEADVRMMEPFYQLSKGHARPESSITLDYQATIYGWMPIRAVLNGHFLVALVGISTVLLDVFSVTVGSFSVDSVVFLKGDNSRNKQIQQGDSNVEPTSQDESFTSFWVSLGLSVGILLFVITVACLVYARRRHPFLPREPSTIAAVLSFIYSSKMLSDFVDTEHLDARAMEKRLMSKGKTYGLGWFRGRDGKTHCAIDEEPMLSEYVHGVPYSAAVVSGPLTDHEAFYVP